MSCPTFLPLLSLNITPRSMPQARPGLGGLTEGTYSNPIKTDRYNSGDSYSSDWNKLDIIQPTPKRLCNRSPKDCTYCAHNAPHPSPAPSDWSSEDWDGDKAKAREQRSLIDLKLLDAHVQDTTWETMPDRQEKDLVNIIDNLMLDQDKTAPTDTLAPSWT